MPLQPLASFTITRQIGNHTDTDTNYVKAVIRNAYTDTIIDTVALTDKGSQRFKNDWRVPGDTSGQGFYISIVTSVYTDSGYTTKNPNYADEENTYLVQERVLRNQGGGGIAASDVRRIIKEELEKLPKIDPIDYDRIPKPKDITDRTDEIIQAIKENKVEVPEPLPPTDRTDEILSAISSKEVTPQTDLSPILAKLDEIKDDTEVNNDDVKSVLDAHKEELSDLIKTSVQEAIDSANFVTSFITHANKKPAPKDPTTEPQLQDVKQLAV